MTLHEAFHILIHRRAWYKPSGVNQRLAFRDKKKFLEGKKLPESKMRNYLSAAGWLCTQQEEWKRRYPTSQR